MEIARKFGTFLGGGGCCGFHVIVGGGGIGLIPCDLGCINGVDSSLFLFFFWESFVGLFDLGWVLRFVNVVGCCGFSFWLFFIYLIYFYLRWHCWIGFVPVVAVDVVAAMVVGGCCCSSGGCAVVVVVVDDDGEE